MVIVAVTFYYVVLPNLPQSTVDLRLGDGLFRASVANNDIDRNKGLSGETKLASNPTDSIKLVHNTSNALANAPILSLRNKIIIIVDKSNDDFMDNPKFLEFVNMASNSINMRAYEYKTIKDGDNTELASYNNTHLTIVIPDKGANPENPDAQICRNNGVQMVAMIFQQSDERLKESNLFFDKAGYAFAYKQA